MAFVDPNKRDKRPVPHEPGQWVELRPLMAADYAQVQRNAMDKSAAEISIELLALAITSWSYPREVTVESIGQQDIVTFQWMREEMQIVTDGRTEDEKKVSEPPSSPTTDPAEESSPVSLAI